MTDYSILVNKKHLLKENDIPDHLVFVPSMSKHMDESHKIYLNDEVWNQFQKMSEQSIMPMYVDSGYRSFQYQQQVLDYYYQKEGEKCFSFVAVPGTSEHQTGLALDFGFIDVNTGLPALEEVDQYKEAFDWVITHAHLYGFILRYPKGKEEVTGYKYEPWHLRYVGIDLAKEIYTRGETLEEYTAKLKKEEKYFVKRI